MLAKKKDPGSSIQFSSFITLLEKKKDIHVVIHRHRIESPTFTSFPLPCPPITIFKLAAYLPVFKFIFQNPSPSTADVAMIQYTTGRSKGR